MTMNKAMNYNRTPLVDIGHNVAMSAEMIRNTLRGIADLMGVDKPNADELMNAYHWRECDGTHVVYIRKKDNSTSIFRYAPN